MTTPARKLLLLNRRGGQTPIEWLLFDDFSTNESAPLASPRTAEPGPGTWTCNNVNNRGSISGGVLTVTTGASADTWSLISSTAFSPNTAIIGRYLAYTLRIDLELCTGAPSYRTEFPVGIRQTEYVGFDAPATAMPIIIAAARSSAGHTSWYVHDQIWWTTRVQPATGDRPAAVTAYQIYAWQLDWVGVRTLPADLQRYQGNATLDVATAVSGTSYTADADGFYTLYVTAPNPLSGSAELRFRVQDANNYWVAYFNDTGAFCVDSVSGGTPTNRINVSSVIGAGNTRVIRIRTQGTFTDAFTLSGTAWTKRGGRLNVNYLTDRTTLIPVVTAGWTLGTIEAGPSTLTAAQVAELARKI